MEQKLFAFVACMLLLTGLIPMGASQENLEGDILYVDDDNTQGPWEGSIDHPYQYIQDAVDVANDGTTIIVFNGLYSENIILSQSVTIKGENKELTIVDGGSSGGVITIENGNNIFIENVTIQNGIDETENDGWGISAISTESLVISNTIITNNEVGILLSENSKDCMILKNNIDNNDVGVDICTSSTNLIYANTITENGINLILFRSTGNMIVNNNIYGADINLQFYTSGDQLYSNYWGTSSSIFFAIGKIEIESLGFVLPWIKFDVAALSTIDSFDHNPIARMKTSMGTMMIEMYQSKMPITTNNFIRLSEIDFFDQLVFHRVIDDFVIQGGGYYDNGTNKESPFGTIELEINPEVNHVDGAISMARTSDPNSATSQFFICDGAQNRLDGNYSAFGKVIVGIDVLRSIASVETKTKHGFMRDWPVDEVYILEVEILYT